MKLLQYVKVFSLITFFHGGIIHATDIGGKSLTIPSLTQLCLQKINNELKEDCTYVSRIIENLPEQSKESILQAFPQLQPIEDLYPENASINRNDPALFYIQVQGKRLYILGSLHIVPMKKCFKIETLRELKRIALENPVLYTEHESSNEYALNILTQPNYQIESNRT